MALSILVSLISLHMTDRFTYNPILPSKSQSLWGSISNLSLGLTPGGYLYQGKTEGIGILWYLGRSWWSYILWPIPGPSFCWLIILRSYLAGVIVIERLNTGGRYSPVPPFQKVGLYTLDQIHSTRNASIFLTALNPPVFFLLLKFCNGLYGAGCDERFAAENKVHE